MIDLKEVKSFIENLDQRDISFDSHFYKRVQERPVSEGMVRSFLSQPSKLEKVEHGKSDFRLKLWFRMSNKYSLVLIVEVDFSKGLKVISAWNSDRKWQKQLR